MRVRRLWPASLLLLAPVLVACSDDGDPDASDDPTSEATSASVEESGEPTASATSESPAEVSSDASPSTGTLPSACDAVSAVDIETTFALDAGAGKPESDDEDGGGKAWATDDCEFEVKGVVDITVRITGPDNFTKGTFGCVQPDDREDTVEPVDIDRADQGWWSLSPTPPLEATMRACSAKANVDIDIDYEDGVDYDGDPRSQASELATLVLGRL